MNTFLILDAARCGFDNIEEVRSIASDENAVVFSLSEKETYLEVVAPHLFSCNDKIIEWYMTNGYNDAWGILFTAAASFDECLLHFNSKVITKDERGGNRYFRFYDPRVLKIFLPACNQVLGRHQFPVSTPLSVSCMNHELQRHITTNQP